jgi:colanic acid biosynthesis glycosyl transferase WcaI
MASPQTKPRLWIVTELYFPEDTSTGYYMTRLAEGLAGEFDVKVLCGQPTYSKRGTRAPKHEVHNGVEIFRAAGTTLDKNVIPFRLINMTTLGISVLFRALFNLRHGDRVLVVTTPPSMPFIVAASSLLRGASYTLLIHDSYPEILVAVKTAKARSFFVNVLHFLNRWLFKYAAKIVVVGRDMAELTERKTAGLDIPIAFIPNWAELETVSPEPKGENELLRDLGLTNTFIFLYAGNMGHPNDLETIVEAANRLADRNDIHFVFLGTGVKRRWLERSVKDRGLSNITILDPRPREEQRIFLNACDVAIVALVPGMIGVSMPSRTYNALAAGKPILALAEAGSEVHRVIGEDGVGWIVPPGDPDALTGAIKKIVEAVELIPEISGRARNAAIARYSAEEAIRRYTKELNEKY